MPCHQSAGTGRTIALTFVEKRGSYALQTSAIPSTQDTPSKVEDYINNTWIPANIKDSQAQVHVIALNPLQMILGTWNIGDKIPANWWLDG